MIENNNLQENELVNEGEMIDDTAMKADLEADFEALDRKKNSLIILTVNTIYKKWAILQAAY